ncbi:MULTISPECIES: GGDEF domain-containing protein [Pseudoalteromonas]|jgi:diguanylate cyclase (GGDEF)-like protein|uniref:GGDEF domain-containing protein n=1 Tax=Pseudoalteromonas TaxID=53246 RepID=UPI0003F8D90D|nr:MULTISPECIES: GGDEF domain-containing protein [Pseudoalteromonas]MBH0090770.1 GGDEF domain-containing protein [Pseudoalteromonas sp. NSLLW218]WMS90185.1 GGDEF domain-containing protein [Pseudoalteromonas sp. HL-AS1]
MIETVKLTVKLSNFYKMPLINKVLSLALLIYIAIFSAYSLTNFPPLQVQNNVYGFTTDFINLIVLVFLFWMVQCSELSKQAYIFSSLGLLLWSIGATADVLDELVVQPYWVSIYFEDLCRTSGMLLTSYGLFKTMRFVQSINNRLARELIIDDLTKVHNRRYFYQHAKDAQLSPFVILIIDIDHFKAINDEFGHDVGDVVLKELATKYDNAFTYKNKFARLGGEEFGGYLPTNNMMQACDFSKQLITIAHTINVQNSRHLTVSIGVAMQTPNEPLDKVMKRADQALYLAKKNGRDRFEVAP